MKGEHEFADHPYTFANISYAECQSIFPSYNIRLVPCLRRDDGSKTELFMCEIAFDLENEDCRECAVRCDYCGGLICYDELVSFNYEFMHADCADLMAGGW